jgi:CheY-like chemotaxis protein
LLLGHLLESSDAVVAMASSVEEAISSISTSPPDVLVSDIGMPGASGYDLIRHVRALATPAARTPAVALTAYAGPEDRARALLLGFDHYVTKPVEAAELLAVVVSLGRRLSAR